MKKQITIVFTDDRPELEGYEIRNYGSSIFEIYRNGEIKDAFQSYETNETYYVSQQFAWLQASERFDELFEQEKELYEV